MAKREAFLATVAICAVADVALFLLAACWTDDLAKGLEVFLVVGGPFTVLVGWPAYVLLQ